MTVCFTKEVPVASPPVPVLLEFMLATGLPVRGGTCFRLGVELRRRRRPFRIRLHDRSQKRA